MTEPGAGSDLQGITTTAKRDGDDYILNGQKTFISNGILADLVIVVAKTDPDAGYQGISLLVVERGMDGFERGRNLDKIGLKAQDTAELFFDNVRVPATNLLGEEGKGFVYLMEKLPQERLAIAVVAAAACESMLETTLRYVKDRKAFGRPIGSFQNSRFVLAELATETQIARVFVDRCIEELNAGKLIGLRRRDGQVVDHRVAEEGRRPLPPALRRLRLHDRVPDRQGLPGHPRPDHLRRHHRDHEGDHRPDDGNLTSSWLTSGSGFSSREVP